MLCNIYIYIYIYIYVCIYMWYSPLKDYFKLLEKVDLSGKYI